MEGALKGKKIIVFGATGRVGIRVCMAISRQGADVAVHCNHGLKRAEQIAETIISEGGNAIVVQGDVTVEEQAARCVRQAVDRFGRIDGVVNLIHRDKEFEPSPVADMTWENWEPHIDAMKSYFHICKSVLPYMRKQQYGKIVYLSGGLSFRFFEGCAPFSAVKAGMNAFGKTLALEEGKNHITVNAVAPGKIYTSQQNKGDEWNELEEQQLKKNPLGRFATPDDVANAIIMFLMPENDYMTGQTIYLAGGEIMPMP